MRVEPLAQLNDELALLVHRRVPKVRHAQDPDAAARAHSVQITPTAATAAASRTALEPISAESESNSIKSSHHHRGQVNESQLHARVLPWTLTHSYSN